jgi:hypothetical protein
VIMTDISTRSYMQNQTANNKATNLWRFEGYSIKLASGSICLIILLDV